MTSDSRPNFPWLNTTPKSRLQPTVAVELKSTQVEIALNIPQNYPYKLTLDGDKPNRAKIPYYEWRGRGPPPGDVGYPGDVYLDLTPGAYALYAYTLGKWVKWVGPCVEKEEHIRHPHLMDRFLGYSEKNVNWYSFSTIKGHARKLPSSTADEVIRTIVKFEREENRSKEAKRRRRKDVDLDISDSEDNIQVIAPRNKRRRVGIIASRADTMSKSLQKSAGVRHRDVVLCAFYFQSHRLRTEY
jgi:hypothetical protein